MEEESVMRIAEWQRLPLEGGKISKPFTFKAAHARVKAPTIVKGVVP